MFLFLICISTTVPNIYYISQDLLISCLDGDISKYQYKYMDNQEFKYKEDIMKSEEFFNKITEIKQDSVYIKINNIQSKVKVILFMYLGNSMMIINKSIIFLSSFFQLYDLVIDFYTKLYRSREDLLIASSSLYMELSSSYLDINRMNELTFSDIFIMMNHIILEVIRSKPEIYNFNLTINSRSSESFLIGLYFISNILNFRIDDSFYIDFGSTCVQTEARNELFQSYDLDSQYKITDMSDLVELFVKYFMKVEVKIKILNKIRY